MAFSNHIIQKQKTPRNEGFNGFRPVHSLRNIGRDLDPEESVVPGLKHALRGWKPII